MNKLRSTDPKLPWQLEMAKKLRESELVKSSSFREAFKNCEFGVWIHPVARYVDANRTPGDKRDAFVASGFSEKKLQTLSKRNIAQKVRLLAKDLRELQYSSGLSQGESCLLVSVNEMPHIARIHLELDGIAKWLKNVEEQIALLRLDKLEPRRIDEKDAALSLCLYVEQQTGERPLQIICEVFYEALLEAGLADDASRMNQESLEYQIRSADPENAARMLAHWRIAPFDLDKGIKEFESYKIVRERIRRQLAKK